MNVVIFDTETTDIKKPFCYNIGYQIRNLDTNEVLIERDYVVEQIWHNIALFSTAYYAEKRPLYVKAMRGRKAFLQKYGAICKIMRHDFKKYKVAGAYAFNSPFDDKVFDYNCGWFKSRNPFDTIPIFDIRGYVHHFIVDSNYENFCETNGYFTESGNYSTTAETVYRYLVDNTFEEEHTALADSRIEAEILIECLNRGATPNTDYIPKRSIVRNVTKKLEVTDTNGNSHTFDYNKIFINKEKTKITLR